MKKRTVVIILTAVAFSVIAVASLRDNIFSPYVPLRTAMDNPQKHVQVIGKIKKATIVYNATGYFFIIHDDKSNDMMVFKSGMKPLNFEHADQVVLIGSYNSTKRVFEAEKLLTKCPSRYTKGK